MPLKIACGKLLNCPVLALITEPIIPNKDLCNLGSVYCPKLLTIQGIVRVYNLQRDSWPRPVPSGSGSTLTQ